jgi:hypothetical protein
MAVPVTTNQYCFLGGGPLWLITALSTPVEPCIFAQQGLSQRVGKDLKSADPFFYHEKCLEVLDFVGRM